MFKESKALKKFVEDIIASSNNLNRGDILFYQVMTKLSGLTQECPQWGTLVKKIKGRILRDRGIVIVAEPNVGYRFLTTAEQLRDNPRNRSGRGRRQFLRGANETKAIPDSELDVKQREIKIANHGVMKKVSREALRTAKFVENATRYESIPVNKKPKPLKEVNEG